MKREYFIPGKDLAKQLWLQNFAAKLPTYAAKYGITAAEVTDTTNGSDYFAYWLNYKNRQEGFTKKVTKFKNEMRDGIDGNAASQAPVAPTFEAAPTAVSPGIFTRVASIVKVIKAKTNYTVSDGEDMGIEGSVAASKNLSEMKPVFNLRITSGGHPEIVWSKEGMDGIHIYVDRGSGTWQWLAMDSYPNYTDTSPLPAAGVAALWQYKIVYRLDDEEVGQFSDVASISVTGNV